MDKTLIAYIRTGAAAASPSPSPLPPPRDLSAPISTIGAAPGASAAAPQPAPSGETSPAGLARSFEGRFASTRHPFSPRRPYDWELLDGSGRRYAYLNIGKLVGMPIPGTGTSVWWERQIDPTLVFGIPEVGLRDPEGQFLEKIQVEPSVLIANDPGTLSQGRDVQVEKAVEVLMHP